MGAGQFGRAKTEHPQKQHHCEHTVLYCMLTNVFVACDGLLCSAGVILLHSAGDQAHLSPVDDGPASSQPAPALTLTQTTWLSLGAQ